MTEPDAPVTPFEAAVSLDNSPGLAMPALHRAVIGPMGEDYYLPIFSRFEAAGEATLSWNWSACLFSLNWILLRGLWGVAMVFAAVLLGMVVLLLGLRQLVFDWPPEVLYGLIGACLSLGVLVPGAWGNALFFNHSRKAMVAAIEANPTLELACTQLRQRAASRGRLIRILIVNGLLLLAAAALAYWLLPESGASIGTPAAETTTMVVAAPAIPASQTANAVAEIAPAASEASAGASGSAPAAVASDSAVAEPAAATSSATAVAAPESAPAPEPAASTASAAAVALPSPAPSAVLAARASKAAHAALKAVSAASAATAATVPVAAELSARVGPAPTPAQASSAPANGPSVAKLKPPAIAATERFLVNAGLFAQPDNARKTLARLKAAGLPAFSQELQTPQGPRTRVRVGPFAQRAQAQAAVKKIHALKLDAALVKP
ncbi:SPOR domain-containing protein [Rhodoferax antarcticus]|uniref:SPOR domain-containing protein n=1 Tax=Rhodoferax antarcticus TaxID=81479 RepID=UPI002225473D|nr:SPOR domain-containing protein [Rhodoferax antarcticus]MCW2312571.1 cell division protein FtsN [Rhodoferax antarcticus]